MEGLVPSPGANGENAPASPFDPQVLAEHLGNLITVTLGASKADLEGFPSLLSNSVLVDTLQRCSRFALESQAALYVKKDLVTDGTHANGSNGTTSQSTLGIRCAVEANVLPPAPSEHFAYTLSSELSYSPSCVESIAILKLSPEPLDPQLPITTQVSVIKLPGISTQNVAAANRGSSVAASGVLHSYLHLALSPYFEALTKQNDSLGRTWSKSDSDSRTGVPNTKKKIAELELNLLQLQQNSEIPALSLTLDPSLQFAIDKLRAERAVPTVERILAEVKTGREKDENDFLNSLQKTVNGWVRSIRNITDTTRDASQGTATQEIAFWLALEDRLDDIESQLASDGVQLTVDVLRAQRKFSTTISFTSDTGLSEKKTMVQNYNMLIRDFPLDDLLSATSLPKVKESIGAIFNHMNKKLRQSKYPVQRALYLVEAISADLDERLHTLIRGRSLMHDEFSEFQEKMRRADEIWFAWDQDIKDFTSVARDVSRKLNKFIPVRVIARHAKTQERLKYINNFRQNHEQLQKTIVNVLGSSSSTKGSSDMITGTGPVIVEEIGDIDALDEVSQAYAALKDIDVLDVSVEGTQIWANAEEIYNERTSRVENTIITRLRDRLATAKSANEMFRVFSQFNALFVRPKIRGAISEYQTTLIDNVKTDISALHERFKTQYGYSQASSMGNLRDIPPMSGAIIWARQIERQLDGYMKKVEDILGENWTFHAEGRKLYDESSMFRKKLETRPIFDLWYQNVQRRNLSISGRLFSITRNRAAGYVLEISVNFDDQVITLFKEVRNLVWLNFQVPHAIKEFSKQAKCVYPYAVSMMDSIRTYSQTQRAILELSEVSILISQDQNDVRELIQQGIFLKWDSYAHGAEIHNADRALGTRVTENNHVKFVSDFATKTKGLNDKTAILASMYATIQVALAELETCPYVDEAFRKNLDIIQQSIDDLSLKEFVNLRHWVVGLNDRIEAILATRLHKAINDWIEAFTEAEAAERPKSSHLELDQELERELYARPNLDTLVLEITMRNQLIFLDPPLAHARAAWIDQLHSWIGIVCSLQVITAERYEHRIQDIDNSVSTVYTQLPIRCIEVLSRVYDVIEERLSQVTEYVAKWLQFQSLWDLQASKVYEDLGDDLACWLQLLQEIRKSRSLFDTSEVSRSFGHVIVDYEQVQNKVNSKYDQWQHEIVVRFASKLGGRMVEVFADIERARKDLEMQSLEGSSTGHAVAFITAVQQVKRKVKLWTPEVETFRQGQVMLSRQRHQLPANWLHIDQVQHEWEMLNEILERKAKIVQDQTDALRANIAAEDKLVHQKIVETTAQWNEEKPISGHIPPEEALLTLQTFGSKLTQLQTEVENLGKAKEALDLPPSPATALSSLLEEVQDFQSVWSALGTIWNSINELRESLWNGIQPRKLRQSLDNLIKMTKEMPSRMRQYAAFEHVQNQLKQFLKMNPLLSDMRSDAVRERHWTRIFKTLKPSKRYSQLSMTLGDVWDLNLVANESVIRDVLAQAQGEMALEEFIKQVRETWQNYSLDLVNYKNKCRLIRGWDDLFAKCSENLNSLQAMRHSPYYKEFEEDASLWEEKLNRVHVLFDVWIDVQRQWVYLEGVFTGNADIKHLLPLESSRFQNIDNEFLSVMRRVAKNSFVVEVLGIEGVQKSLERLAELLNKIQKALGEYLERERVSFPRFYFVGDEDLLEIIGNSNDSTRVSKHLRKMFAGLAGLKTDDGSTITGFISKEGEEVTMTQQVSLIKTPRVNEWLGALEQSMKVTLATLLVDATERFRAIVEADTLDQAAFEAYMDAFPAQIVVLATQCCWTALVEESLDQRGSSLATLHGRHVELLKLLAAAVLGDLNQLQRKKAEHLITEFVHQRDVIASLLDLGADSPTHYMWLLQMRYVYSNEGELLERLKINMANAIISYGYEYLGVAERLVRTPLTDRCFLTLTQALSQRLGGSPYGPAGTGKTESVKALGVQLGRFTLVFCCDDTFDFQAMGRIFLGVCQVGAWGCFDEFNRLEERILSAVSQQIQNIQLGLRKGVTNPKAQIELIGRSLRIHNSTGIFVTMNPGYAGRSNLPDNLKKLFRSVAMSKPDKELIAEVMLFSQGFSRAKELSKQTVPFFDRCGASLSKQAHYDFGLRALKSVLVSSGGLKRARLASRNENSLPDDVLEPQIIVQSLRETMGPKLIRQDVKIMEDIEQESFRGVEYIPAPLEELKKAIYDVAATERYVVSDSWMTKVIQLYQIQNLHHGVMMVGSSGSGKSSGWRVLLKALQRVEGVEGVFHVIDPKVMSKEHLYGSLDNTTREWTDGLFTSILRKIVDNLRNEDTKRHWIVFDGDVDPEWVENLNSVLDDNKLLTLPNSERLNLPPNVRVMFEVETLKYATLATVSRCGMVWFSDDTVSTDMIVNNYLATLREVPFDDIEDEIMPPGQLPQKLFELQGQVADFLQSRFQSDHFIQQALDQAQSLTHIMEYSEIRALKTLFSLLNKACRSLIEYNVQHPDFPLEVEQIEAYVSKKLLLAMTWSFSGDCPLAQRKTFGDNIAGTTTVDLPSLGQGTSLIDFDVVLPGSDWTLWQSQVPSIEINTHSVTQTDVVIPTLDTVRHEDVLYSWLAEHKPLILCGPPGSGKTMTLFSALRKLPNMEVVGLNFSSATTPDLLIKTFEQYCEYKKNLNGVMLTPSQIGRWLVIFCDEVNLPAPDQYGTQRAISFLRQLIEQNGFWRTSDKTWVTLDRIQFVGACNPPTDAGRTPLGLRFLRHAPLVMVDYPGELSLLQIYGTFNTAVLKIIPALRGYADPLTKAMVQLYLESQKRFTPDIQPHYVYSPRELTRWVRGLYEAIKPLETLSLEGLVRIWAHEALRLFQDRLIAEDERVWTQECVNRIALEHFPTIDEHKALGGPLLFSNWLSKNYLPVQRDDLRDYVKARLRTFCEEELDVPLVLFNDVLEHVLRIDRVFRQPQGHLILIGVSGSGKTTLSRFVAWMNGLSVFQIKVHGKYSAEDFDEDLRNVLRRCGCKGEKVCFIMDESNVLDSGFLERMNTLLANAEVPGLFEGDEYATLMTACREGAQRQGLLLDSQEELYKWFTQQIVKNLHVVFTMNPPEEGLSSKAATSPALFNRCVLNWFGDWSDQALFQFGSELTQSIDLDRTTYECPETVDLQYRDLSLPIHHRDAVVNAMVYVHYSLQQLNTRLQKQQNKTTYLTPRHFLDFVAQYVKLYSEKRDDLEEQQRHLNVGLDKLRETVTKVSDLRSSLAQKQVQLERKDAEANEKLQRMIADQREAEKDKAASLEIQAALEVAEKELGERRDIVHADLARAEPAVEEAKKSVSAIKKQQLNEVRSMGKPPTVVKLALEAVCMLLGHRVAVWEDVKAIIRKDDFIRSIVEYQNEVQMTRSSRIKMQNDYLSKEEFSFERVNHASKACGPLVQWVQAQVMYSEMLDKVGPLREEVHQLEEEAMKTKAHAQAIENKIIKLENSIATYKTEYAALVSEVQSIKSEMARVQSKVDRSMKLLDSLSSERSRWEDSSKSFSTQIDTIVGDVLVAAAFIAYGGFYDQQYRKAMTEDWLHHLSASGIQYKPVNPVTEYLSTADERLHWQENSLPVDDLCTENAIILKRFNRYPLIIDPSGRVTEFLQNECKQGKRKPLTVTSFLDDSFVKQLESALRFGNPILIQDAEHLDPILTHVLNKEYQKTGGRVLIQLGKQEIDFTSSFRLYLTTRDPSAQFAPDICSRTTFVNFTVTQSSLQTQSLNEVLKSERPDVDERRSNFIKMQGEYSLKLRHLEKDLLQALNASRGNILDDDNVMQTLETLKKDAADINAKAAEAQGVMQEVDEVTRQYAVVAKSCSAIFVVLEQLHRINHFYQFSLQFFVDIFEYVLGEAKKSAERSHNARIDVILRNLFSVTFSRTALSLLQKDRVVLAMLLAQASPYKMDKDLIDAVLDKDLTGADVSTNPERMNEVIGRVAKHRLFKDFASGVSWNALGTEEFAERHVPAAWAPDTLPLNQSLRSLILIKLFRIDRLVPATERFISTVFGDGILDIGGDLEEVVKQVAAITPIALSSSPGFDASYKVDNLVERTHATCAAIAMGSDEGVSSADKAVTNAAQTGSWVIVKNVHLAPGWLQSLEKRINSLRPHPDFRLFLSMETSPKIPVNILRASRVLMYEQPAGIRANMKDSLSSLSARATKQPVERARLYLLLCFLHAVVQERLRYAPTLGWKGFWEFNDSDYECCSFIIDTWVESAAQGRTNLAPKNIPWDMLRTLTTEMYGGKIDDEHDFKQLSKLVNGFLTPAAFEENYNIIKDIQSSESQPETGGQVLNLPGGTGWTEFMDWVNKMPEREPPTFLGLPSNAEKLLLVRQANEMVEKVGSIMKMLDEGDQVMAEAV